MPYTQPFPIVTDTPLEASDVSGNLSSVATYYTHGVAGADIGADALQTTHVVRPNITPINEALTSTYLQSGSVHSLTLPCIDLVGDSSSLLLNVPTVPSGFVAAPYQPKDFGVTAYKPVPRTWISFYVYRTSIALVRVNGTVIYPEDHQSSAKVTNPLYIQLDGTTNALESMSRTPMMDSAIDVYSGRQMQTVALFENLPIGWHHVGLVTGNGANLGLVAGTQIVLEVFHVGA